jgi:hypothetical protein
MPSSFTTNKTLELPANGAYVDTWNVPVNGDMTIIDQALGGTTSLNATGGSATLSVSQYRSLILQVSGAITTNVTYTIPATVGGQWLVYDTTTATNGSVVKIASGGGGTIATCQRGNYIIVGCDGTNCWVVAADASVPTGGGSNQIFYLNDITVTENYTVPVGSNAMTAGPVSINSGVTVTVSPGSYWTVV